MTQGCFNDVHLHFLLASNTDEPVFSDMFSKTILIFPVDLIVPNKHNVHCPDLGVKKGGTFLPPEIQNI